MSPGQHIRRLGGSHILAAAVAMIGWRARHGMAALHTLLVQRHGRHAIAKLQKQQSACRHDNE
jgi:hypothetical protein